MSLADTMPGNSFKKAWGNLRQKDAKAAREEIKAALHIESDLMFRLRRKGTVNHKPTERDAIEKVFKKFGVTDVWGQ